MAGFYEGRPVPLFVPRTFGDGLLDSRRYKLRCFAEQLVCAALPSALVVAVTLVLGGGAGALLTAVVALLFAVSIATSVRTIRAALVAGIAVAAFLVFLLVAASWLFSHPIIRE
jgi:hypothetical protein